MALPAKEKILQQLQEWLVTYNVNSGEGILLAVSGGVDSMCLLALFTALKAEGVLTFDVMHINHQLRDDADLDQQLVVDYCEAHDLDLAVRIWRHGELETGIEEQARHFRYANFAEYLHTHNYHYLVTAHHLEDVSETAFMRLIQGYTLQAIQSMPPITKLHNYPEAKVARPLIDVKKEELYALAEAWEIPFREDPSNKSMAFTRNRIRNYWLEALKEEDSRVVEHLYDFSRELQATLSIANRQLKRWREEAFEPLDATHWLIDRRALPSLSPLELEQLLMICFDAIDPEAFQTFGRRGWRGLVDFLLNDTPQGEWNLPGDYLLRKEYQAIIITRLTSEAENRQKMTLNVTLTSSAKNAYPFPDTLGDCPLIIRDRQAGDRVRLNNDHHQKLTRFLINQKVAQPIRDRLSVVVAGDSEVLGIVDPPTSSVIYAYAPAEAETKKYWRLQE